MSFTIKYFCAHINYSLKWNYHVGKVTKKANFCYAPAKTKLVAFKGIVRSTLEYPIWSPHYVGLSKSVDNVLRKGIRRIYHLPRICSITDCMDDNNIDVFLTT